MTANYTSSEPAQTGIKTDFICNRFLKMQTTFRYGFILLTCFTLIFCPMGGNAQVSFFKPPQKKIVLDPGHGGHDTGAKGPGGVPEKTVTLNLAQKIQDNLKSEYTVILTRTDDYWLDLPGRTAIANHEKADLFVSLHTGASFLHQRTGVNAYYLQGTPAPPAAAEMETTTSSENEDALTPWGMIQNKHTNASRELAQLIKQYLIHPSLFARGNLQAAPLIVLAGADMPAVLIEPGYLTNPVEEKILTDPETTAAVAERISNAIIVFLKKSE